MLALENPVFVFFVFPKTYCIHKSEYPNLPAGFPSSFTSMLHAGILQNADNPPAAVSNLAAVELPTTLERLGAINVIRDST